MEMIAVSINYYFLLSIFLNLQTVLQATRSGRTSGNFTTFSPILTDEAARERLPRANNLDFKQAFHQLRYSESNSLKEDIRQSFMKAGINNVLNIDQLDSTGSTKSSSNDQRRRNNRRIYPRTLTFTKLAKLQGSWCQKDRALIKVRARGCQSRMVQSFFCYGQCVSLFIPQYKASGKYLQVFKTCGFCQPSKWDMKTVRLDCPSSRTPYRVKRVPVVASCSCVDVYRPKAN